MNNIWLIIFIASSLLLLLVLLRNRLSWKGVGSFAAHFLLAAAALYVLNYSGVLPGEQIPLNPVTIGTVVVLGIPGVALIMGLQWLVI
ncbi:pro-sigmaK processing inhibitor BofA family protein [Paenibacillus protaetiae]|uniref:Pro-sigmaK processing inhibitor BofA n=1 Tax=Paenibacillus protaetiae TaxID=2509456 RepID=A0A4P6F2Y6_9BACL|nr:pro-sigmaK processing inhibitor BofA family protein [Paenibacillus protaetiae]QAY68519.1 pro-sigmaK processing inhibitor BofA [Paenibacillus protaetiae]